MYVKILFAALITIFIFSCEEDLTDTPVPLAEDSLTAFLETYDLTLDDAELRDDYSLMVNVSHDDCSDDYPDSLTSQTLLFSDTAGLLHIITLFVSEDQITNGSLIAEGIYYFAAEGDDNYHSSYTIGGDSKLFYSTSVEPKNELEEIKDGVIKVEHLSNNESKIIILLSYGDDSILAFTYEGAYTMSETFCSDD